MKAVIQRVSQASVTVNGEVAGKIDKGLLVLLGITHDDREQEIDWMIQKIVNLRIFEDDQGKMNLSLTAVNGQMLVVSQFTLYADITRGNRPSFIDACSPEKAERLYNAFVEKLKKTGIFTATGVFGADMQLALVNDGPVTIILQSEK